MKVVLVFNRRVGAQNKGARHLKSAGPLIKLVQHTCSIELSNEIAALRGRSVQKLLATNHVFKMKEEPMAMAADGEDVVQMVVKEQNRELPDEELDDDIKKEVKDVTASIQDTEQKEMTIDDDMAAHAVTGVITAVAQNTEELPNPYHQSCDYNTKNDL